MTEETVTRYYSRCPSWPSVEDIEMTRGKMGQQQSDKNYKASKRVGEIAHVVSRNTLSSASNPDRDWIYPCLKQHEFEKLSWTALADIEPVLHR